MENLLTIPAALQIGEQWVEIILFVLALILIWIGLRFVLGLASRLLRLGCMLILTMAVLFVILRFFG